MADADRSCVTRFRHAIYRRRDDRVATSLIRKQFGSEANYLTIKVDLRVRRFDFRRCFFRRVICAYAFLYQGVLQLVLAAPLFRRRIRNDRFFLGLVQVNIQLVRLVGDGCSERANDRDVVGHLFNLQRRVVVNDCGGGDGVHRFHAANARNNGYLIAQDVRRYGVASIFRFRVMDASVLNSAAYLANGCVYFAGVIRW